VLAEPGKSIKATACVRGTLLRELLRRSAEHQIGLSQSSDLPNETRCKRVVIVKNPGLVFKR
jgi:hypothetical protein